MRERYDPEDIEQLLSERGFDELLEEERAYVLRHLSGREEYERMRSTLHFLRHAEPERELLVPDPEVRADLLNTFREARRTRFTIWLNTIGAWLMPQRPSLLWRPVLALAGLALVTLVGVGLWRGLSDRSENMLARAESARALDPTAPAPIEQKGTGTPSDEMGQDVQAREAGPSSKEGASNASGQSAMIPERMEAVPRTPVLDEELMDTDHKALAGAALEEVFTDAVIEEVAEAEGSTRSDRAYDGQDRPVTENDLMNAQVPSAAEGTPVKAISRKGSGRDRTGNEMAKTGTKGPDAGGTLARTHADLLVLLHRAW
ncbi:MAG: hypothetical protein H6595_11915 [Flavobacteriales bacterium]|nr:hypothetical protein [Flavobacteriales bacterium]MCB9168167.1 hypothetical protein [Flavobacteriales bacterium]MCB9194268.1 hypothetical protein [Flavobacteriales bacterium]